MLTSTRRLPPRPTGDMVRYTRRPARAVGVRNRPTDGAGDGLAFRGSPDTEWTRL